MAIAVVYEQHKPHAMAFAVNDRRAQSMTISNYFADRHAMFKIQSTSPKKFRVRPAFAALPPNARVAVSILLSPQEREPSACKFLVVVREVEPSVVTTVASTSNSNKYGDDPEHEMKLRWKQAERRQQDSLLFSETVDVEIVEQQQHSDARSPKATEQEQVAVHVAPSAPSPTLEVKLPARSPSQEASSCLHSPAVVNSTEQRAEIVVLLMKNQSSEPKNRLMKDEKELLRRLRASSTPEQWCVWQVYAYRMRVLLREQSRRWSRPSE